MLRRVLAGFALLELLVPQRVIAVAERLALENPDECELRPWTVTIARLEAAVFLLAMRRSRGLSGSLRALLVAVGVPAALFPRQYLAFGAGLAYVDASTCRWKSWVVPMTRALGIVYVLAALRGRRSPERVR